MGTQRFRAVITADPEGRAVITMPFDPDETWGAKADHPVGGTIDGCRFRARLWPGGSGWVLTVRLRDGVAIGDEVTVELTPKVRNAAIWPTISPRRSRPIRPRPASSIRWRSFTARHTCAGSMPPPAGGCPCGPHR